MLVYELSRKESAEKTTTIGRVRELESCAAEKEKLFVIARVCVVVVRGASVNSK